jgi:hypothetical protein
MKPGEHKTLQARILEYAEGIGWTFVPHEEAERRRLVRDWRRAGMPAHEVTMPSPTGN